MTDLPAEALLSGSDTPLHRCSFACKRCWTRRCETRSSALWRNLPRATLSTVIYSRTRAPTRPSPTRHLRCRTPEDSPSPASRTRSRTSSVCRKSSSVLQKYPNVKRRFKHRRVKQRARGASKCREVLYARGSKQK